MPPDLVRELARKRYWGFKRGIDIAIAAVLSVLLAPVVLLVAVLVALDVGRPLTFWQQRPGLGGVPFKLRKFRTMAEAHDASGNRLPDDSRISALGRFLRRSRLDELPQLVSILRGEMSFVGPRPLLAVDQSPDHCARLLVRPGLTGWAQVKGGREITALDKAALDVWYVKNASLALDASILLLTVLVLVRGERDDRNAIGQAWRELGEAGIWAGAGGSAEESVTPAHRSGAEKEAA